MRNSIPALPNLSLDPSSLSVYSFRGLTHCLTSEFYVKFHEKNDIEQIAKRFRVKFNVESRVRQWIFLESHEKNKSLKLGCLNLFFLTLVCFRARESHLVARSTTNESNFSSLGWLEFQINGNDRLGTLATLIWTSRRQVNIFQIF